jgi:phosphoribosylanthranilate isomerase
MNSVVGNAHPTKAAGFQPRPSPTTINNMFRVKICGITTPENGAQAIAAGADAIGLNFFRGSRRFVTLERAKAIAEALPPDAQAVGVFVNAPAAEIREIASAIPLNMIQLHGDEPVELVAELADLPIVRAFRLGEQGWEPCQRYLDRCRACGRVPSAVLVDAFQRDAYGGTGKSPNWATVRQYRELGLGVPLILAGGLTPDNVADAIKIASPDGVDTAGGVESAPGIKDANKVAAFVAAARAALACYPCQAGQASL